MFLSGQCRKTTKKESYIAPICSVSNSKQKDLRPTPISQSINELASVITCYGNKSYDEEEKKEEQDSK